MYAKHTPINFCVIIEKWLKEQGFDKLNVIHQDIAGIPWCNISIYDKAQNPHDVGWLKSDHVVLFDDLEQSMHRIEAYDMQIFEKLAVHFAFAKP